jgi:peptidyl-prolyl cis-trans isomerase C
MMFKMNRNKTMMAVLMTAAFSIGVAQAKDESPKVLLKAGNITVTELDVEAELLRASPDAKKEIFAKLETLGQVVNNIYLRRALAQYADQQKLLTDKVLKQAVQLNQERFLTDLALEHIDRVHAPSAKEMDKLVLAEYKANASKYETPEQVHIHHILIKFGENKEDSKAKALKVLERLKNKEDFEALAKELSEDPGSGLKGGDLGVFGRGRMVKPFEEAAFSLKNPGDLSDLVESQFGYHILRLDGKMPAKQKDLKEVKDSIAQEIFQKQAVEARKKLADEMATKAEIKGDALKSLLHDAATTVAPSK